MCLNPGAGLIAHGLRIQSVLFDYFFVKVNQKCLFRYFLIIVIIFNIFYALKRSYIYNRYTCPPLQKILKKNFILFF